MKNDYKIGDIVRINCSSGSWGEVINVKELSGQRYDTTHKVDVKWTYGKDVKGEYITAVSRYINSYDIIPVSPNDYYEYINCRAWSDEQKIISDRVIKNETF